MTHDTCYRGALVLPCPCLVLVLPCVVYTRALALFLRDCFLQEHDTCYRRALALPCLVLVVCLALPCPVLVLILPMHGPFASFSYVYLVLFSCPCLVSRGHEKPVSERGTGFGIVY